MDTPWSYLLTPGALVPVRSLLMTLQECSGPDLLQHAGRVATEAARLAMALHLPPAVIEEAVLVGWLHEVGRPTADGSAVDRLHANSLAAEAVLRPLPGLFAVSRSVRSLAERWDGRGGPEGLWEMQIPPAARIVAVADTLDTLLHGTPVRRGVAPHVAADWIRRESGRQFDPAVVDVCLAMLEPSAAIPRAHREAEAQTTVQAPAR
jgi:putative two-component system response regulator